MIDRFEYRCPILEEFVRVRHGKNNEFGMIDLQEIGKMLGLVLAGRDCLPTDENGNPICEGGVAVGDYRPTRLTHPFESLPTSYTDVAFKIVPGSANSWPYFTFHASPAKLLQGHNVFGSDDPELCGLEIIGALLNAYPQLYKIGDWKNLEIYSIDCTYSTRVSENVDVVSVINFLQKISVGHLRVSKKHDTTIYFNHKSEHGGLRIYGKSAELKKQLTEFKKAFAKSGLYGPVVDVLCDQRLQQYSENLLRFEAIITRRKLQYLNVPSNFYDFCRHFKKLKAEGRNLIWELFMSKYEPLMKVLDGKNVDILNLDSVHSLLKFNFDKINSKGRLETRKSSALFRVFSSILDSGYERVKKQYSSSQWNKYLVDFASVGISRAVLSNFENKRESNVMPVLQIINIDFNSQFPDWYVEPVSRLDESVVEIKMFKPRRHLNLVA